MICYVAVSEDTHGGVVMGCFDVSEDTHVLAEVEFNDLLCYEAVSGDTHGGAAAQHVE
jgi:hypothetical protein